MPRRGFLPFLILGPILITGCGKKGPIEPPLVRVPQTVESLRLIQRGPSLILTWTNPSAYIDGSPLTEVSEVEIWLIKEDRPVGGGGKTWTAEAFEGKASLLARISRDQLASFLSKDPESVGQLTYSHPLSNEDFGRKVLTFSVRVRDPKKRVSSFAAPASAEAMTPPARPRNVRAVVHEDYILVSWESAAPAEQELTKIKSDTFNVYRSEDGNAAARMLDSSLKANEFRDKDFSFGRTYRYFIRASIESKPQVESEDSETVEVVPKDVFPPAPPPGLTAISGPGFIALNWEAGREPDLAGYKVWRREAGQAEFIQVASLLETQSSFSDSEVEKGRKYEYAISALDRSGNESLKSEPVSGTVRDDSR